MRRIIRPAILHSFSSFAKLISRKTSSKTSPTASKHNSTVPPSPYETNYHPDITGLTEDELEQSTQELSDDLKKADEYERTYPLLNLDTFDIRREDAQWFREVNIAVRKIMNGPMYDVSHNYQHARRVVENGKYILECESKQHQWARDVDTIIVYLGCLVHDIGDRKYRESGETRTQEAIVKDFLSNHGCPPTICQLVAFLVPHVSFTLEKHSPDLIASIAEEYPALRIIQDADRLDGLGTVGIARALIYHGVDEILRHGSMDSDIALIRCRFRRYVALMKTETGKKLAEKRYKWMTDVWAPQFWRETVAYSV